MDTCECPGDQCHCEVLTAYARECERAGYLVHNWREATNCKNITSYPYKMRNNLRNQAKFAGHQSNSVTDKTSEPKQSQQTEWRPSAKKDVDLRDYQAAWLPKKQISTQSAVQFNRLEKRNMKTKLSLRERRKLRRQKKRKARKQRRRKKMRRKQRKRKRQHRRRNNRKKGNGRGKQHNSRNKEFLQQAGVTLQHVQSKEGKLKPRLNWSKYKETTGAKSPPFESLLTSLEETSAEGGENTKPVSEDENYDYDEVFEDFTVDGDKSVIIKDIVNSENRVPLPLLDDSERLRGTLLGSDSLLTAIDSLVTAAGDSDLMRNKRSDTKQMKSWKHTRRRSGN